MRAMALVTDDDLARARQDPAFRHQLVASNLELLLGRLNVLHSAEGSDGKRKLQVREGVDLAVQLAELLQRLTANNPDTHRAS
jgi:hypothetical protein